MRPEAPFLCRQSLLGGTCEMDRAEHNRQAALRLLMVSVRYYLDLPACSWSPSLPSHILSPALQHCTAGCCIPALPPLWPRAATLGLCLMLFVFSGMDPVWICWLVLWAWNCLGPIAIGLPCALGWLWLPSSCCSSSRSGLTLVLSHCCSA